MKMHQKISILASVLTLAMLTGNFTRAQEVQYRLANSNGTGTLKVGDETFKITSVVVKLMDDQRAELTLISDITVFLSGTWTAKNNQQHEIDLTITGGATQGGLDATGRLILSDDGKSVLRLSLQGSSHTRKRHFEVTFASQ
ncbi:MAG TPA: hypothetical protein VLE19_00495 [Pyrinomonadaceae bacterium]|nr:hypothetical protein [Pyrinomonadaceae bacterium]